MDQKAGHLSRQAANLNPAFSEEGTITSSSMTDPSSDSCYFQNKIHVLTELTHAQPKVATKQRRQPHAGQAEQYLHYLDDIAALITVKVDNGQDAAATCFRSSKHIRILWTLGGNATRFDSHPAAQAVDHYLHEIRRQLFECDDLQEVLQLIVSECKPTILRYFQEILRCMARNSSGTARARMPRPTKVRGWNEELRMLIRETDHYIVKGICSSAMKDEHAANYDLFVQKISNVDEGTSCCELADLVVYCYFLTKSFGMTAPISKGLRASLKDAGRLWSACKDLRHYVVFARRRYRELSVEFQHAYGPDWREESLDTLTGGGTPYLGCESNRMPYLCLPTPPPQKVTYHVSPVTALKLAIKSDDFFGGDTLLANLATYRYIPLSKPCCPISTTTTTSIPHPELVVANYLLKGYKSTPRGSFHNESNFAIGTSRPVCRWCSQYFDSIRIHLAQDHCDKMGKTPSGRFRSDKQVVVSSSDIGLRDSDWVMPTDTSPPAVRSQLELLVDDEFAMAVKWLKEVGQMPREERDLEVFEQGLQTGEKTRKRKRKARTRELEDGSVKRRKLEVDEAREKEGFGTSVWSRVEREIGGVVRWVWRMSGAPDA
ncbi:MAG: hypothetical protein LQ349_005128 [Xanthoria aureola]|nr:MAG: hypothetical protein LQ349_005128 [Xanthoria aureola]